MLLSTSVSSATAAEYKFCTNAVLAPGQGCTDSSERYVHGVYGSSVDGAICAGVSGGPANCSKGPSQGVYIGEPHLYGQLGRAFIFHTINIPGNLKVNGIVWDGAPAPPFENPPPPPPPPSPENLMAVTMNNSGSKQTEVHVLNGATHFQTWGTQLPTPLAETQSTQWQWTMGDDNQDGVSDLIGINMNNTGSKQTQVHVLNGATNFQTWLTQVPTPLAETQPSQWQWMIADDNGDGIDDLVGITMNNTGSKKTEVHVLNGATNYQTWLTQVPTPLAETKTSQWQWTMADENGDGIDDLVGVAMNSTGSKKTEVHVLNGATNFQTWLTQLPTPLAETSGTQWRFIGER